MILTKVLLWHTESRNATHTIKILEKSNYFLKKFILGTVLTPSAVPLQPLSSTTNNNIEKQQINSKPILVGSTWKNSGNINIDLDNLLTNKPKTGPSPSMNQLASNPTSPINQPRHMPQMSTPGFGTQLNFNSTPNFQQSNINNQFFASFK